MLIAEICSLLGAIALFLCGLKEMSEEVCALSGGRMKKAVQVFANNRCSAVLAGCAASAICQSSVATNMAVVGFVEAGAMTFVQAAATIMGTNIGTTVTAQIISFSAAGGLDFTPAGCAAAFAGILLKCAKNKNMKSAGGVLTGFGFVFMGLDFMTDAVACFKNYEWFKNLFLADNPFLLFVNGMLVTAAVQSGSVVTGMTVIFGSLGLLSFENSAFLILGSNIGSCMPVLVASAGKSEESQKAALFNLVFNAFGAVLFFIPLFFAGEKVSLLPFFVNRTVARKIANFHTFFNVVVCLIALPALNALCAFTEKTFYFLFSRKNGKAMQKRRRGTKMAEIELLRAVRRRKKEQIS